MTTRRETGPRGNEQVTAGTLEEACRAVLAGRQAWDEEPAVYFIYHTDEDEYRLSDLGLPAAMMHHFPTPGQMLAGAAELFRSVGVGALAPGELAGAAYRDETWWAEAPKDDPAAQQKLRELRGQRRLKDFPGRREARMLFAGLADGTLVVAQQFRGSRFPAVIPAEAKMAGGIPDGLRALVRALTSPRS